MFTIHYRTRNKLFRCQCTNQILKDIRVLVKIIHKEKSRNSKTAIQAATNVLTEVEVQVKPFRDNSSMVSFYTKPGSVKVRCFKSTYCNVNFWCKYFSFSEYMELDLQYRKVGCPVPEICWQWCHQIRSRLWRSMDQVACQLIQTRDHHLSEIWQKIIVMKKSHIHQSLSHCQ